MSITSTSTSSSSSSLSSSSSSLSTTSTDPSIYRAKCLPFDRKRFIYEQYPKALISECRFTSNAMRLRSNVRFRTQPITLAEINETEEENKLEHEQSTGNDGIIQENFLDLQHLAFSENIRRSARKKAPLKNFVERQRLKSMREETSELDGN